MNGSTQSHPRLDEVGGARYGWILLILVVVLVLAVLLFVPAWWPWSS